LDREQEPEIGLTREQGAGKGSQSAGVCHSGLGLGDVPFGFCSRPSGESFAGGVLGALGLPYGKENTDYRSQQEDA
jgi:hypothetical protein